LHAPLLEMNSAKTIHASETRNVTRSSTHRDVLYTNPLAVIKGEDVEDLNNDSRVNSSQSKRLSRWFVNNQKRKEWNKERLNKLHISIVSLFVIIYFCHIIGSPFIKLITNETISMVISSIELVLLIIASVLFVKMCYVNGSMAVTKTMFQYTKTYIYLFWTIRSFIIELCKGQIIYSFVHVFHSVVIYSSDMWYICSAKTLTVSFCLFLSIIIYEFFISISPVAPKEPEWTFMNVKTNANSLSRSNIFNIFVIFGDALIILIYDTKRSTYIMLSKKKKRQSLEFSTQRKAILNYFWQMSGLCIFVGTLLFIFTTPTPGQGRNVLENTLIAVFGGIGLVSYFAILKYSSDGVGKILYMLLHERKTVLVLILLGVLTYVDNFLGFRVTSILFTSLVCAMISLDMIRGYFPKRFSLFVMATTVLLLLWNTFNQAFLRPDCTVYTFPWGIFGEEINYCTIKRLIYQSILSLIMPACVAAFSGRATTRMFFCNTNILRSTGTISQHDLNITYVTSLNVEKNNSMKTKVLGGNEEVGTKKKMNKKMIIEEE
jgi:hypothetical protein